MVQVSHIICKKPDPQPVPHGRLHFQNAQILGVVSNYSPCHVWGPYTCEKRRRLPPGDVYPPQRFHLLRIRSHVQHYVHLLQICIPNRDIYRVHIVDSDPVLFHHEPHRMILALIPVMRHPCSKTLKVQSLDKSYIIFFPWSDIKNKK